MRRPKILLIADVPNWIFERHCFMLQRNLSLHFDFTISYDHQPYDEKEYDLIYPLEWYKVNPEQIKEPLKYVSGIRSHLVWTDYNFSDVLIRLGSHYNLLHTVSKRLFDIFSPHLPNVRYVSHGVDTSFFTPTTTCDRSGGRLRLGWAGNRKSVGKKGFEEFIEPLGRIPGVELVFCGYSDRNLTLDEMRLFYDSLDAYVCASDFEGNNNSLLEAASMARAIITTDNGTVPEYLENGRSALIVSRDKEAFMRAVIELRDDPAKRKELGRQARQEVLSLWNWEERAEDYRRFFEEALERREGIVQETRKTTQKILIACTHFWPSVGGVETIAAGLGEGLVQRGFAVDVATLAHPSRSSHCYRGLTILSLDPAPVRNDQPQWPSRLRSLICSGGYRACILIADPLNPIIWSLHKADVPPQTRLIIQPVINRDGYDRWRKDRAFRTGLAAILKKAIPVALTRNGPDAQFLKKEGIRPVLIPNAVEPLPSEAQFRKEYGVSEDQFLILHIANLWRVKNHVGLLHALRELPERCRLVMIGHPSEDAGYVREVHEEFRQHSQVLHIPGLPPEWIAAALKAADLVVLASHGEAAPVNILEAMSHGVPWLATADCGAVNEHAGGLVLPLERFAQAISHLQGCPSVRLKLGQLGYKHWLACYCWRKVIEAWEEIIETGTTSRSFSIPPQLQEEQDTLTDQILRALDSPQNQVEPLVSVSRGEAMGLDTLKSRPQIAALAPLVSVIVPTHNRPGMLRHAIASIMAQTFKDFEIVVVNDAGDDVSSVAASFCSGKIRYLSHQRNRGLAAARNTGIRAARGRYIAYLDDDDVYYPDHLETLISFMRNGGEKVAYSDAYRATQTRQEDGSYEIIGRDLPYSHEFDYKQILIGNFIPVLCVMHEAGCIEEVGLFDEELTSHEDWDLWIRLSRRFSFHHVKRVTCEFRWRQDGSSMTSSKEADFIRTQERVYEKYRSIASTMPDVVRQQELSLGNRKKALERLTRIAATIVIPVLNQLEKTKQCLHAVLQTTPADGCEVIVVDNGSTDGTREYLESLGSGVTTIFNSENRGFVAGTNQGAARAKGKYLVFLNNDTVPQAGWLDNLIAMAEGDPAVGAVGAKLVYPDGRLQEAGALIFSDGNGWNFGNGDSPEREQYNTPCEVDYCSAACLLVRRDLFAALGGLDERFSPAYYEETDLCFGLRKLGYKVMYNPNSVIVHHESATAGSDPGTGFKKYLQINRVKFVEKWSNELVLQDPPPHLSGRNPKTADRKRLQKQRAVTKASSHGKGNRELVTAQNSPLARKAVVFFPHNPYPPKTGAHQRCISMIEALKDRGCSLTLASSDLFSDTPWRDSDIHLIEEKLGVTIHLYRGAPTDRAYISRTRASKGEIINWDFYVPPGLCCDFENLCNREQPDLVLINYAYWGRLIDNAACRKALKIIDIHDLLTVNTMMKLHISRYLLEGTLDPASVDPALVEESIFDAVDPAIGEAEYALYDSFDFAAAISSKEEELLSSRLHQAKTVFVPMTLAVASDCNSYSGNPIFVISDNPFNVQGYLYFTMRVLPEVLREIPQMTLDVVGSACKRFRTTKGVNLLGFVPDLEPLYAKSRFAICPLLGGTGQQVKIVEAMAHGVPVVAMKAVAATSPICHGVNGFIASDAAEFASYVIRLYREPELARRLGQAARETILEGFSKKVLSSRLEEMLSLPRMTPPPAVVSDGPGAPPPLAAAQRILWIRCDSIGDNVLAAAMLPHLRAHYPQASVTVFCQHHIAELYEASPFVSRVICFDKYRAHTEKRYRESMAQRLLQVEADLALYSLYSRDPLYDWFAVRCGAKERIALQGDLSNISGPLRDANNRLFSCLIPSAGHLKSELARHRDFLNGIGIDAPPLMPVIWLTDDDHSYADEFFLANNLRGGDSVALFAGAQSPLRCYAHYGRALADLCRKQGLTLLALGAAADREINQASLDEAGVRGINLSGQLTLRQSAAILKRCRLAVGAETGLAHIACAVGTPNVVLVGGGHFARFMPYSPLTSVVCLPLACYSCNWYCRYLRAHCVKDVHPAVIAEAVRQALAGRSETIRVYCQSGDLWRSLSDEPQWAGCEELLRQYPVTLHRVETEAGFAGEDPAAAAVMASIQAQRRVTSGCQAVDAGL